MEGFGDCMGTVTKALDLLGEFSRLSPQVGLSDLARRAGLNKATCYRLLSELQARGFVEQVGSGREYRLGPAVLRLAALREATVPLREAVQPILKALSAATGETAHLSMIEGDRLGMLAYAYSPAHGMRVMMEDAEVLPFHATSSGLAVLAHADPGLADRVLSRPLPRLTDRTETDPDRLRARLDAIRAAGIAESIGGFEAEVHSLAVPVFDASGSCCGALAVAAPAARMTPALNATIRAELTAAAGAVAALWGGMQPPDQSAA